MNPTVTQTEAASTPSAKTPVLTVGDWRQREFAEATVGISEAVEWANITSVDEACRLLTASQQPPELILLAQPLPSGYEQSDLDRLQQLVPLTRLVIVTGSWCEGELRTGTPPSGVIRLYWYDLAPWWQTATRRRDEGQCPLWSLPLDHAQAGRCSTDVVTTKATHFTTSVLIDAQDFTVYQALAAGLDAYGISSSWLGRNATATSDAMPAKSGIWDGGQLSQTERTRLGHFCEQVEGPVIALLDFPRVEHVQQAKTAGATDVFAKPYVVEEIIAAIVQAS